MNLIPILAKELEVEIGEEFELDGYCGTYSFKENGLCYYDKQRKEWTLAEDYILVDILRGVEEIKKLPFEPKEGEQYWVATWDTQETILTTCRAIWHNRADCYADKYVGNCFRTEAEAEAHKFEIFEKLTGKKWEE